MPSYREASYGGETVVLENEHLRLEVHKRSTGWGWGELYFPGNGSGAARFFAVHEHLGQAGIAGYDHPLRLEAADYVLDEDKKLKDLSFDLDLNLASTGQKGDSPLKGRLKLWMPKIEPIIHYSLTVTPQSQIHIRSLRGPWLRVGADSFGTDRHDAIFPGIEWLMDREWSSGTDWFEHPEALRVAPHPHKVAIPAMAISHDGIALALAWNPNLSALSFGTRIRYPQPVFASPNFIDRRNDHLLGLMLPSARWGLGENELVAEPPVRVPGGLSLCFDAEIHFVKGTSLDALVEWVKRSGMPDPGPPRYDWEDALERIARAYNTNLWNEGKGWGLRGRGSPAIPSIVRHYIENGEDQDIVEGLKEKISWCEGQKPSLGKADLARMQAGGPGDGALRELCEELLKLQTPEGDFPFDPGGRHSTGLLERAALWRPLGLPGESSLDLCSTAAGTLIVTGRLLDEGRFLDASRRTLDFAMRFERPEGGDWWETPLHSPNLLAAGNAAITYYLGYEEFGDERYLERARHWIRSLIPFTHLWEPEDLPMIYNTKPCFCSTSWFLSDWTAKHVQWEVLTVFAKSERHGIDWSKIDPEVDWNTYQRGITTAVLRWMIDHKDPDWMFRSEFPSQDTEKGEWDTCFSDTFDPVSGTYGGAPIMPTVVGDNILIVRKQP